MGGFKYRSDPLRIDLFMFLTVLGDAKLKDGWLHHSLEFRVN